MLNLYLGKKYNHYESRRMNPSDILLQVFPFLYLIFFSYFLEIFNSKSYSLMIDYG
jgi:hypothetical protein